MIEKKVKDFQDEADLTDDQVEAYRQAFLLMDIDGDEFLEEEELVLGLEVIGMTTIDPDDLHLVFSMVDEDKSGTFDLSDYIHFMYLMCDLQQLLNQRMKEVRILSISAACALARQSVLPDRHASTTLTLRPIS